MGIHDEDYFELRNKIKVKKELEEEYLKEQK